jgi:hypothetical protein
MREERSRSTTRSNRRPSIDVGDRAPGSAQRAGDGRYLACADFKGRDGHTYDVDVFMRPESTDGFVPTDVLVHKQDGKPRFNWVEQNGLVASPVTVLSSVDS